LRAILILPAWPEKEKKEGGEGGKMAPTFQTPCSTGKQDGKDAAPNKLILLLLAHQSMKEEEGGEGGEGKGGKRGGDLFTGMARGKKGEEEKKEGEGRSITLKRCSFSSPLNSCLAVAFDRREGGKKEGGEISQHNHGPQGRGEGGRRRGKRGEVVPAQEEVRQQRQPYFLTKKAHRLKRGGGGGRKKATRIYTNSALHCRDRQRGEGKKEGGTTAARLGPLNTYCQCTGEKKGKGKKVLRSGRLHSHSFSYATVLGGKRGKKRGKKKRGTRGLFSTQTLIIILARNRSRKRNGNRGRGSGGFFYFTH